MLIHFLEKHNLTNNSILKLLLRLTDEYLAFLLMKISDNEPNKLIEILKSAGFNFEISYLISTMDEEQLLELALNAELNAFMEKQNQEQEQEQDIPQQGNAEVAQKGRRSDDIHFTHS